MLALGLVANVCLLLALWGLRERIEIDLGIEGWFGIYMVEEVLAIGEGVRLGPPGRSPF